MRFPSVEELAQRAGLVALRFPLALGASLLATVAAIAATMPDAPAEQLARFALLAMLAIPIGFAAEITAEARRAGLAQQILAAAGIMVLIATFGVAWPGFEEKHHFIRYLQLSIGLHLLVAVLPFLKAPETPLFWQYNRTLFLNFLRAAVFSAVLFHGLAIALAALDKLFGLSMPPETYLRLFLVLALLGNTWIFLAGMPALPVIEQETTIYPRALKVFTQFILLPLVMVYMALLLAYLVKIVLTGAWPEGWIGWLVTAVAFAGMLGFLLAHPLRSLASEGWIRTYSRWVFVGLVPAALMLLVALWKRIQPYGLTELRYLGIILACWLLIVAVRFALRPGSGIRIIPMSLAAILLLTLFGPLGATHRAVASQRSRLSDAFRTVQRQPGDSSAAHTVSAATLFLVEHRASAAIATAYGGAIPGGVAFDGLQRWKNDSLAEAIVLAAGLEYRPGSHPDERRYFSYSSAGDSAVDVSGFRWLVSLQQQDTLRVLPTGEQLRVDYDSATALLTVSATNRTAARFNLRSIAESIRDSEPAKRGPRLGVESDRMQFADSIADAVLLLDQLSGESDSAGPVIRSWSGRLLLR